MTPFGDELLRAMIARGLTQTALAARSGYGATNLHRVLTGERMPAPYVVARLAEALSWPSLVDRGADARSAVCALCGVQFVRASVGGPSRYCSRKCRRAVQARQSRESKRRRSLTETRFLRERLDLHQSAIGAFCRGCEPEGECRDSTCALREVSPLPLASRGRRVA